MDKGAARVGKEQARGSRHCLLPRTASEVKNTLGKYAEAEQHATKAIAIRTKLGGPDHELLAHPLSEMARALYYQDRYAEAVPVFRRAAPLVEKRLGTDTKSLIEFLELYSSCLHKASLDEEAKELEQRIKKLRQA